MSELKTKINDANVDAFIAAVEHPTRQADAQVLLQMMAEVTGCEAKMWGKSLVGFDSYDYTNANGKSGKSFICGFSPRKQSLSVYIMPGFSQYGDLLASLGKHKIGKSCLYINKLADVDLMVLKQLVAASVKSMRDKYG